MKPINKYEAMGIFVSVAAMAILLVFVRYDINPFHTASGVDTKTQLGSVVVVNDSDEDGGESLADALISASNGGGLEDLVIDDIVVGEGSPVEEGDVVSVHYIGSTQNGVEFDNSYTRGQSFSFKVGAGRVIEGWDKGLLGMQTGGQRILVIPADMAYGDVQVGPIPAGSNLVFAIELLEIN